MRTARSRTSREYLFALVIGVSSQHKRSPANPGRFKSMEEILREILEETKKTNEELKKIREHLTGPAKSALDEEIEREPTANSF